MANRPSVGRPLSPHLTIWRWGPHMAVSILHRVTGNALAFGVVVLFAWWLLAVAGGREAYALFASVAFGPLGYLVGIGSTWAMFQHMGTGVRHLVMDTGAGYDLATARKSSLATVAFSLTMTVLVWGYILFVKGA
ncbi:MAG: succinate dehydrogenase, cytochrome b556 subunit [Sphingomonadales bacterium]